MKMKKINLFTALMALLFLLGCSKNEDASLNATSYLFITKRDYSNSSNYVHSLQKINSSNGSLVSSTNFTTAFPNSYTSSSLTYNATTNEIFGISGNIVTKSNCVTNAEASFTLPVATSTDYQSIIIANNRLFVAKRNYSSSTNINSLQEINQSNGSLISSHNLIAAMPDSYNKNLTFSKSTNEIIGLSGNLVYKYNIITGAETDLFLPALTSGKYNDILIAENRLFVLKRDYSVNPPVYKLLELNISSAAITNSHVYTTDLSAYNGGGFESLTFLANTHEICARINSLTSLKVIKYNIVNNSESNFDLPFQSSTDYDEIISTFQ